MGFLWWIVNYPEFSLTIWRGYTAVISKMATPMEVQTKKDGEEKEEKDNVVASSGAAGSVAVALHPLVIMNISEHYTRIRAQEGKPNPQGKEKNCRYLSENLCF
jgi:hypothetical protein